MNGLCYLFELKFNRTAKEAPQQIHSRGYAEKYAGKTVTLVGVNFDSHSRSINEWEEELKTSH